MVLSQFYLLCYTNDPQKPTHNGTTVLLLLLFSLWSCIKLFFLCYCLYYALFTSLWSCVSFTYLIIVCILPYLFNVVLLFSLPILLLLELCLVSCPVCFHVVVCQICYYVIACILYYNFPVVLCQVFVLLYCFVVYCKFPCGIELLSLGAFGWSFSGCINILLVVVVFFILVWHFLGDIHL